jgi:uncharacterized protein (DUF2249 family)
MLTENADQGTGMSSIEDECEQTIDVREIEGEPFGEIMAALEGLGAEDRLHLVSAFEPIPLYEVLSDRGFGHETEQVDEEEYHVLISRTN